jgi:hypothetical protein
VREFKRDVKEHAIVNFMIRELRVSHMEASPAEIKEYYDSHIPECFHDSEIDLKQIILGNSGDGHRKLKTGLEELSKEENFFEVAKKDRDGIDIYDIEYVFRSDLRNEATQAIKISILASIAAEKSGKQLSLEEASQSIENRLFRQYEEEVRTRGYRSFETRLTSKSTSTIKTPRPIPQTDLRCAFVWCPAVQCLFSKAP